MALITSLSVSPPVWEMADDDREQFIFDANEPIVHAYATLIDLARGIDVTATCVENGSSLPISGTQAIVWVSNLSRGVTYELGVTFETSNGRRWTRTLILSCVA